MNLPKQITLDEFAELLSIMEVERPETFAFHVTIDENEYICGIGCPEKTTDVLEDFLPNGYWAYIMSLDDDKFVCIEMSDLTTILEWKASLKKYMGLNESSNIILESYPSDDYLPNVTDEGDVLYQCIAEEDIADNVLDFWKKM